MEKVGDVYGKRAQYGYGQESTEWAFLFFSDAFGLFSVPQWFGFIGGSLNNKGCALQKFVWAAFFYIVISV